MKKPAQHLIAEVPRKRAKAELTIGIDLGDVWSHYCTLNQEGEVVDRGRFRTTAKAIEKWFAPVPHARVAMEAGVHSIWISEQLEQLGHEVIVANVRELRAISHSDRKSDDVDAEKLARYARLDPEILRPISHRTVEQQEALTLIRARELLVRLRTAAVNAVRGLTKACGHRMPASSTKCFAQRGQAAMPPGLKLALGPILAQIAEMTLKIKQYDREIQRMTQTEYAETQPMMTIHGVGHITALTFVLTLGDKTRFGRSRDVGCYLGLRPKRSQSGERDPQLGITKAGNAYLRSLLIECANHILRPHGRDSALRQWGLHLAARGGKQAKNKSVVAVARKLAVLLHHLWTTQEAAIKDSPEQLKPLHENLLRRFAMPHAAKAHYENLGILPSDQLAAIDRDIAEANENFHTTIEESFEPYLEGLRRGDLAFLSNDKDTVLFYRGLAVQYMRTNHKRRTELMMAPESKVFYERTANVLTHIFAVNIGYSLFNDHPKLTLAVIENPTDVRFITTDQPVINIAAKLKDTGAPDKFEAYYPVSPVRALLILEPDSEFLPKNLAVSAMEAHFWNLRIASRAYRQIFAQSTKELKMVKDDMPAFASCH